MRNRERRSALTRGWPALAAGLALLACSSEPPWAARPLDPPAPPGARLYGVVFDAYRAGSRNVRLSATSADVDWGSSEVRMERVRILLPGEDRGPVDVEAPKGRIDLSTRAFVLEGGVSASTGEGERFRTSALRYEPDRHRLVSRDPVRVTGSRIDVVGSGMEIDVGTRRVRLLGPVRATTESG